MNLPVPAAVAEVTGASFAQNVLATSHERLVLVDVWAAWCGPCKALAPLLEEVARVEGERTAVFKLDADAEPELTAQLEVRALPTILFYRRGEIVDRLVGLHAVAAIRARIEALEAAAA